MESNWKQSATPFAVHTSLEVTSPPLILMRASACSFDHVFSPIAPRSPFGGVIPSLRTNRTVDTAECPMGIWTFVPTETVWTGVEHIFCEKPSDALNKIAAMQSPKYRM